MDVATLGVKVTLDGVVQATNSLNSLGAAGTKTAASVQDFARAGATANQIAQLTGTSMATARDAVARYGSTAAETALEVQGLTLAQEEMAAASIGVAAASDVAFAGLGRVRQGLVSLVAQSTGTIPVVDRLGASLLSGFGVGQATMIAVLAGGAALLEMHKAWSEEAVDAAAKQDKLTESLVKWYEKQAEGPAGEFPKQIEAMKAKLVDLHKEMDGIADGKFFTAVESVGHGGSKVDAWIRVFTAGSFTAMAEQFGKEIAGGAAHIAGEIKTGGKAVKAAQDEADKMVSDAADKAQMDRLHKLEAIWADAVPASNAVVDSLEKQSTSMQKAADAAGKLYVQAQQEAALAKVQGEAHEYLANQFKAENEAQAARDTQTGATLTHTLDVIAATKALTDERIRLAQATQDATDRQTEFNKISGEVEKIAKANIKATTEAAKQALADKKYSDDIQSIWTQGIEHIVTNGTKSFQNFFDDVLQMFSKLMDKMRAAGKDSGLGYQLLGIGSAAITGGVAGYQLGQATGSGAIGALGGAATGAEAGKAFGPWGVAIGGLVGAAGGLLGAADAQQKAAEAIQQAAQDLLPKLAVYDNPNSTVSSLAQNQAQFQTLLTALNAIVTNSHSYDALGGLKAYQDQLAALYEAKAAADAKIASDFWNGIAQAINATQGAAGAYQNQLDALKKSYDDSMASAEALHATDAQLASITNLYNTQLQQLTASYKENISQINQSLDAREAYAKGLTAEGDAIARRAAEEKELFDDEAAGYTKEQLARVAYIQGLEDQATAGKAAADAQAKLVSAQRAQEDYATRALAAIGNASGASDRSFALRQARELADAITAGVDPVTLATLRVALADEAMRYQVDKQVSLLQKMSDNIQTQVGLLQTQLSTAQQTLSATKQVHDSLAAYGQSLKIGGLSPLSPIDQLNAARDQVNTLYQAARGGDQAAASKFAEAATTFLQQSQGYNASGAGYKMDFNSVSVMTDTLTDQFGVQESLQQQMVDKLTQQIDVLTAQSTLLQQQSALLQAQLAAADTAAQAASGNAQQQMTAMQAQTNILLQQLIAAQATLTATQALAPAGQVNPESIGPNSGAFAPGTALYHQMLQSAGGYRGGIIANSFDGVEGQTEYLGYKLGDIPPEIRALAALGITPDSPGFSDAYLALLKANNEPFYTRQQFGLPGYASGGDFSGGLRLVGERGPELEATGASRITNTQTLLTALTSGGNSAEVVAELRALRASVDALYQVNRVDGNANRDGLAVVVQKLDAATSKATRDMERLTTARKQA